MTQNSQPFQLSTNGPLSPAAIARLKAIKDKTGMSYASLGQRVGLSQAFIYNLMNKGMNVGTQHIARIEDAVKRMEAGEDPLADAQAESGKDLLEHTYFLRSDLQVSISLPPDITPKEAARLANFIQTLPTE